MITDFKVCNLDHIVLFMKIISTFILFMDPGNNSNVRYVMDNTTLGVLMYFLSLSSLNKPRLARYQYMGSMNKYVTGTIDLISKICI